MGITPRVKSSAPAAARDEAAVERVINRGLAQAPTNPPADDDPEKKFTLRISASTLKRIEDDARSRPGRVSVNTWLLEAIEEQFSRHNGG